MQARYELSEYYNREKLKHEVEEISLLRIIFKLNNLFYRL